MQAWLASLRQHWHSLPARRQRFVSNAVVALLVLLALGFLDRSHWLLRLENSAMDTMMTLNKGLERMSGSAAAEPLNFTFLDIDDASYRAWGEPYHTPRDKLLKLIDFAAKSGAKLIVVDIDLSKPGIVPEHDHALAEYLVAHSSQESTPIILPRTFYSVLPDHGEWHELRPSFLDEFDLSGSIYRGHPLFQTTLWDGVVRHWSLARYGCLDGRLELVPSIQLTATALLSETAVTMPTANIEALALVGCERDAEVHSVPSFQEGIRQRLIYTIGWNEAMPDLVTIPAIAITETTDSLAGDLVDGRVVVIGASFADSGDIHRTPLGEMPGALIIVNAIKSLAAFGQLHEAPVWIQLLLQIGVILLAAWAFSRYDSFVAVGIAAAVIIALLVPVSFYLFKYGLWIGFSLPLAAMLIHRGIAEYRNVRRLVRDNAGVRLRE